MLRALFQEPPRKEEGLLLEANEAIRKYMRTLMLIPQEKQTTQERRFAIWSQSFLRSIDELEQSQYAAVRYGELMDTMLVHRMPPDEREQYNRHLYYYKNALIRLFSILDKLGQFMNERFELQTEKIKSRFSYFTVLRNMHQNGLHTGLEQMLYDLKMKYKEPVARLRNQRNMEIHTIDADLLDDLIRARESKPGERIRPEAEEMEGNLADLKAGCDMAFRIIAIVFKYIAKHPPSNPEAHTRTKTGEGNTRSRVRRR
ncbi:Cthe_2314 family HEPN domain-containing protein [Paenibacillus puerhi]|uniref:Cthe_2314 family HEPN domain-containing protein n=1 Tax=Paenibacillus puerhi TaxID=2692622 RepID=UPI001359982F|nr:Cthe_2314 family HEPN domain-containing protein [Paenibacillus puerhi]